MTKPRDWEDWEDASVAPFSAEIDALQRKHASDLPAPILVAVDTDVLPERLESAAHAQIAASAWSRALVDGVHSAEPEPGTDASTRILMRIRQAAPAGRSRARWSFIAWPALGLTAAAAAILFIAHHGASATGPLTTVPTIAPALPAAFKLPLEPAEIKLTAAALLLRSAGQQRSLVDDLAPAFTAYRTGDYRGAAATLEAIAPAHPHSVEIPFYLGVSRLLAGDANGAVSALETARGKRDDMFRADIGWYLAVARERGGDNAGARTELQQLCRGQSSFSARACALVTKF